MPELDAPHLPTACGVDADDNGVRGDHGDRGGDVLLTPSEVAGLFRVDPRTVTRWARSGKIDCVRTLGGHRRFREREVLALLQGIPRQREA